MSFFTLTLQFAFCEIKCTYISNEGKENRSFHLFRFWFLAPKEQELRKTVIKSTYVLHRKANIDRISVEEFFCFAFQLNRSLFYCILSLKKTKTGIENLLLKCSVYAVTISLEFTLNFFIWCCARELRERTDLLVVRASRKATSTVAHFPLCEV